ncbi:MAG: cellobiose phosphorylase [Candidatus Omnitrophica bacterium]|nr:cellobiose phosphorylase [Candidatus Omnitrophota bacterium]
MNKYRLADQTFIIEEYNRTHPFADFLPSISGQWGVPLWAFFVNRGQAVVSFGLEDKDHCITEFQPANKAYQVVGSLGFRTFVKINNELVYEPFQLSSHQEKTERLLIRSHDLSLEENNKALGLDFSVNYFTLPQMPFGALVRTVEIENRSARSKSIQVLDGLGQIIPFGSKDFFLKNLPRTLEAWMNAGTEKIGKGEFAFFKLSVDPQDVAATEYIEGANFQYSLCLQKNKKIYPRYIVDPQAIFGSDTSLASPLHFLKKNFSYPISQQKCGKTPCGFSFFSTSLKKHETVTLYTVIGGVFDKKQLPKFLKPVTPAFLESKRRENHELIKKFKSNAVTVSGRPEFDEYVQSSYLDNMLRGGYPATFDHEKIYYLYSRKHGDLERDYNQFRLLASYFSEGEGNYRDVNQNRRMDIFFNPAIDKKNIVYFFNLLRIDGYNPLIVRGEKLYLAHQSLCDYLRRKFKLPRDSELCAFMQKGFYLGELFRLFEKKGIYLSGAGREEFLKILFESVQREAQADFGEGFWVDHWRYNLDLIETFLQIYPDRKDELFFDTPFLFWDDEYKVRRRSERYFLKGNRVIQLHGVRSVAHKQELLNHRKRLRNFLRTKCGKGSVYTTNLIEKLLALVLTKVATLDFDGIGIEMEADKPGWCDSLNGLPALFGSSVCESFELKRTALILKKGLHNRKGKTQIKAAGEVLAFFNRLEKAFSGLKKIKPSAKSLYWWNKSNDAKEDFRTRTFWGIKGAQGNLDTNRLTAFLNNVVALLDRGLKKAKEKESGVYYTYFTYDILAYRDGKQKAIMPQKVRRRPLPVFLEGPMHALRVNKDTSMVSAIKKTPLYDRTLKMYRLNASLKDTPLDIGRSRAFPPGWLENESIWLHMEYKYLLELLKVGLYDEFYKNFFQCGICFLDPARYGKNILENSSFIVSSAFPDKTLWGKGYVARLTGATSELLNIWALMSLGVRPFSVDEGNNLYFSPQPALKSDFFTRSIRTLEVDRKKVTIAANSFACKLFSRTLLVYHNPHRKDTYRKDISIKKIEVIAYDGTRSTTKNPFVSPPWSYKIRQGNVREIHVYLT